MNEVKLTQEAWRKLIKVDAQLEKMLHDYKYNRYPAEIILKAAIGIYEKDIAIIQPQTTEQ